ncbi:hypothetical protein, partial [Burkholderia ubonensis]|uniref:hypothetical protein n=1 Tax=Burkholderia ubonensis TaxID=101571 RepID=UPI001E524B42
WRAHVLAISTGSGVDARDSTRDEFALRAAQCGRLNFACPTKTSIRIEGAPAPAVLRSVLDRILR